MAEDGSSKALLRRVARQIALTGYRMVRPVIRPLIYRTRNFMLQSFSAELHHSRAALINEIHTMQQGLLLRTRELQQESALNGRAAAAQILQSIQAARESLREDMLRLNDDAFNAALSVEEQSRIAISTTELLREDVGRLIGNASSAALKALAESQSAVTSINATLARVEILADASARRIALHTHGNSVLLRCTVGYVLCADTDVAVLAGLLDTGELERGTRLLIERLLRPEDVFVDVGAHLGLLTLAAARAMGGRGRIFAFEPFPDTYAKLERSIWLNGYSTMVDVRGMAVADREGHATLHLGQVSGHHSLFPLGQREESDVPSVDVPLTTLDLALPVGQSVTLLKIDVEGAEINVIDGARALLKNNPDMTIIVECGPQHLARTGYTVERWLQAFAAYGLVYRAINAESGTLEDVTPAQLAASESVNLLFGHPDSSAWAKLGELEAAK